MDKKPTVDIVGKVEGWLDVKRLNLPGLSVRLTCPKCGTKETLDYSTEHLSYPLIGKPIPVHAYCQECEHEWSWNAVLNITLEEVK